jgi:hypothetical protein
VTSEQVRTWLLAYLAGTEDALIDCVLHQDDWRHLSAQTEHYAAMAETPGPKAVTQAQEFALSALIECHEGPHLATCPDAR